MTNVKTASSFQPATPLESLLVAGDAERIVDYLAPMSVADRRKHRPQLAKMYKVMDRARYDFDGAAMATWGGRVTDEQWRALEAAMYLCGTAEDIAETWWGYVGVAERLIDLWRRFPREDGNQVAHAFLARNPVFFHVVQPLYCAGLIDRPTTDSYALGVLTVPFESDRLVGLDAWLERDPELLEAALLRLFEIDGTSDLSLAGCDKYAKGPQEAPWQALFLRLCAQGVLPRGLLLEKTISALEMGWIQFRSGWFSRLHAAFDPTVEEMSAFADRYAGLCQSRIPPTVTLAVDALAKLFAAGRVSAATVLQGLQPVLASIVKGQVEAALKLLEKIVKSDRQLATRASSLAAAALGHPAADVQKKVMARLTEWGMDPETAALVRSLGPYVSATNRDALAALVDEVREPAVPPPMKDELLPRRQDPMRPLDDSRQLVPIAAIDELVDQIARLLEGEGDIDDLERVLEALVRMAPLDGDGRRRFSPVLKRAHQLKPVAGDWRSREKPVVRELARLLVFLLEGVRLPAVVTYEQKVFTAHSFMSRRVDDLMDFAAHGSGLSPLASPTHRRGFIDPLRLVERVAAHAAGGYASPLQEQVLSLLRLAPEAGEAAEEARRRARRLPATPYVAALRYALRDDVAVDGEQALFVAAARVRHPGADDPDLIASVGELGPDGPHVARYQWSADISRKNGYTYRFARLNTWPAPREVDPAFLGIMRHAVPVGDSLYFYLQNRFGTSDEKLIQLASTIVPSSLDALFAEGFQTLGNNLDWWEAQWCNKAYLNLLLDPTVPMTPMAALVLACGLAGKEPGQTSIAVDALVASWIDGRLDVTALGKMMGELLAAELFRAPRLAKSLGSAARARFETPRLVFDLLCQMIAVAPDPPPKDTAALLELLLALGLELKQAMPAPTVKAIEAMTLGGRGKALRTSILAQIGQGL